MIIEIEISSRPCISIRYGDLNIYDEPYHNFWIMWFKREDREFGRYSIYYDGWYYSFGFWFFNIGFSSNREITWLNMK